MGRWLGREMTSRIGTGFAVDNKRSVRCTLIKVHVCKVYPKYEVHACKMYAYNVYLISVYQSVLRAPYCTGVYLISVYLTGVRRLIMRAPHRCLPHRRTSHKRAPPSLYLIGVYFTGV